MLDNNLTISRPATRLARRKGSIAEAKAIREKSCTNRKSTTKGASLGSPNMAASKEITGGATHGVAAGALSVAAMSRDMLPDKSRNHMPAIKGK